MSADPAHTFEVTAPSPLRGKALTTSVSTPRPGRDFTTADQRREGHLDDAHSHYAIDFTEPICSSLAGSPLLRSRRAHRGSRRRTGKRRSTRYRGLFGSPGDCRGDVTVGRIRGRCGRRPRLGHLVRRRAHVGPSIGRRCATGPVRPASADVLRATAGQLFRRHDRRHHHWRGHRRVDGGGRATHEPARRPTGTRLWRSSHPGRHSSRGTPWLERIRCCALPRPRTPRRPEGRDP